MRVFTTSGHSTETPIAAFFAASSRWSVSASASTACLLITYGAQNGVEVSAAIDAVITMWPSSPCASWSGVNARTPWITPQTFTSNTHA